MRIHADTHEALLAEILRELQLIRKVLEASVPVKITYTAGGAVLLKDIQTSDKI